MVDFLLDNLFWSLVACFAAGGLLWTFKRGEKIALSANAASLLVSRERGLFLDIRPQREFAAGHIARSHNIPESEITNRRNTLDKYRDKPLVLVCKNGMKCKGVAAQLSKLGFSQIRILSGGIANWQESQLPLTTR